MQSNYTLVTRNPFNRCSAFFCFCIAHPIYSFCSPARLERPARQSARKNRDRSCAATSRKAALGRRPQPAPRCAAALLKGLFSLREPLENGPTNKTYTAAWGDRKIQRMSATSIPLCLHSSPNSCMHTARLTVVACIQLA